MQAALRKIGETKLSQAPGYVMRTFAPRLVSDNITNPKRRACHLCKMQPGSAERMFTFYGREFTASCSAKFRNFMRDLRLTAKMWREFGLTKDQRRAAHKQMLRTSKTLS